MAKAILLKPAQTRWLPYVLFGVGTLAGSTGPIFLRMALQEQVPSPVITALRLLVAALFFTPLALNSHREALRRLSRRDIFVAITAGALFAVHFTLIFESFRFTSILVAGALIGSVPLWTALIERFVLGVRLGAKVWIGLALALTGGALISLSGSGMAEGQGNLFLGALLALAGALLAAVYMVVGRSLRTHLPFVPFVWLLFTSAAVVALITLWIGGYSLTGYSANGYFWVLMAIIFPQLIAHGSFNYILAYLSATLISMSGQLVTVISAIAAFFVFAELPGPLHLIGSAVIVFGVMLAIAGQSRH
jgi:drug/metabolite transporter (DMT)-like permease